MLKSGRDKGSRGWVLEKECISGQHTTEPSPVSTCVMCEVGWRVLEEGSQPGWCHLISWARSVTSWVGGYYSKIWFFLKTHHFYKSFYYFIFLKISCVGTMYLDHIHPSLPPSSFSHPPMYLPYPPPISRLLKDNQLIHMDLPICVRMYNMHLVGTVQNTSVKFSC